MADALDLLLDGFEHVRSTVRRAVDGLDADGLTFRVDVEANTVAWLVWHLIRVQDDHIAEVAGSEQVWTADGWAARFGLPFEVGAIGYGQSSDEVGAVQAPAEVLLGYSEAVLDRTAQYLATLTEADLDRIVDENWSPPVTLAVRLVSVLNDDLQHAGQAAFVSGVVRRRR
jgi:hypothetical protein